jgi:quercetin dioxygenase-like cupin family protein
MPSFPEDDSITVAVPYVLADGEGEVLRWFGDTITVKSAGPKFDVAVITAVSGSEPPLHVHADADEALFVLEGSLAVVVGGERLAAPVGAFVFLPEGIAHSFAVESGSARFLAITAPAGSLAMYSEVEDRFGPRGMPARPRDADLAAVMATLEGHGVTVVDRARPAGHATDGRELGSPAESTCPERRR